MQFDTVLFQSFYGLAGLSPILDFFGVFFARYLAYFLLLALLFFFVFIPDWRTRFNHLVIITLSVILSRGIIAEIIRFFYDRPRPPGELGIQALIPLPDSSAFPSGHASFFFALSMALFFIHKRWGIWFLILSFLMGAARIFVGVHWPLDILGGIVVGIVSALVVYKVLERSKQNATATQKPS